MLLMRGLAAVGARPVAADLHHTGGQGPCLLGGSTVRLDVTLQECEEAAKEMNKLLIESHATYAEGDRVFATFWGRLQQETASSGSQTRSLAGGLEEALKENR
eukprot:908887-Prymnesium_polylepis.1